MAAITTSKAQCYAGGTASTQLVLGYESSKAWVARYSFKSGATGASTVSWETTADSYLAGGSATAEFRWYMGTGTTSHAAGGSSLSYHGKVTKTEYGGAHIFSGSANVVLVPNTTYYLWVFPATTTYGYYWLSTTGTATVTTSGGAGLVYIDNGTKWEPYQVYIHNGSSWDLYMPYIDNGSSWDLYS